MAWVAFSALRIVFGNVLTVDDCPTAYDKRQSCDSDNDDNVDPERKGVTVYQPVIGFGRWRWQEPADPGYPKFLKMKPDRQLADQRPRDRSQKNIGAKQVTCRHDHGTLDKQGSNHRKNCRVDKAAEQKYSTDRNPKPLGIRNAEASVGKEDT